MEWALIALAAIIVIVAIYVASYFRFGRDVSEMSFFADFYRLPRAFERGRNYDRIQQQLTGYWNSSDGASIEIGFSNFGEIKISTESVPMWNYTGNLIMPGNNFVNPISYASIQLTPDNSISLFYDSDTLEVTRYDSFDPSTVYESRIFSKEGPANDRTNNS